MAGKECLICGESLSEASNFYLAGGTVTSGTRTLLSEWLVAASKAEVRWNLDWGERFVCRGCYLLINLSDRLKAQADRLRKEVLEKLRDSRKRKEETKAGSAGKRVATGREQAKTGVKRIKRGNNKEGGKRRQGGQCEECGKIFRSTQCLEAHRMAHRGEYRFRCHVCQKGFNLRPSLRMHLRRHSSERPLVCELCGAGFRHSASLRLHQGWRHGPPAFPPATPYPCPDCNRQFSMRSHLVTHRRRAHTGERPYPCDIDSCPMRFVTKNELQRHQYGHTKKFPHVCDQCPRGFRSELLLRRHKEAQHSMDDTLEHCDEDDEIGREEEVANLEEEEEEEGEGLSSDQQTVLLHLPNLMVPEGSTTLTVQFLENNSEAL